MSERNSNGKQQNERIVIHRDGRKEYWRDIPGYEGFYRASDWGRIKGVDRWVKHPSGKLKKWKGKILKQAENRTAAGSYRVVCLCKDGKTEGFSVHSLVLITFVGPCPEGMEGCHFPDRNPSNNNLCNVRWDTPLNNHADKKKHGTTAAGINNVNAKLTNKMVRRMRQLGDILTLNEIAKLFDIDAGNASGILSGKSWSHVTEKLDIDEVLYLACIYAEKDRLDVMRFLSPDDAAYQDIKEFVKRLRRYRKKRWGTRTPKTDSCVCVDRMAVIKTTPLSNVLDKSKELHNRLVETTCSINHEAELACGKVVQL